ncbi:hypothetical protein QF037_009490 [Streptomyces canus]|nr:hypothetical protein [Streptomyces canus]
MTRRGPGCFWQRKKGTPPGAGQVPFSACDAMAQLCRAGPDERVGQVGGAGEEGLVAAGGLDHQRVLQALGKRSAQCHSPGRERSSSDRTYAIGMSSA